MPGVKDKCLDRYWFDKVVRSMYLLWNKHKLNQVSLGKIKCKVSSIFLKSYEE